MVVEALEQGGRKTVTGGPAKGASHLLAYRSNDRRFPRSVRSKKDDIETTVRPPAAFRSAGRAAQPGAEDAERAPQQRTPAHFGAEQGQVALHRLPIARAGSG